jgi:hypothetical protein
VFLTSLLLSICLLLVHHITCYTFWIHLFLRRCSDTDCESGNQSQVKCKTREREKGCQETETGFHFTLRKEFKFSCLLVTCVYFVFLLIQVSFGFNLTWALSQEWLRVGSTRHFILSKSNDDPFFGRPQWQLSGEIKTFYSTFSLSIYSFRFESAITWGCQVVQSRSKK